MINLNNHTIEVIGLGDQDFKSIEISEAVSDELFRVHSKTAKITFLTSNNALYYSNMIGQQVTIKDNNNIIFEGVVNSTPSLQPFNYELEEFTIYLDDYLTQLRQIDYTTESATIKDILDTYVPNYNYTPNLNIDIEKTYINLSALTDTTITIYEVLGEICKLLNVEIIDGEIKSPIIGNGVNITPHFASTQLGLEQAQNSAEITIMEDSNSGQSQDVEEEQNIVWGDLEKHNFNVFGEGIRVNVDGVQSTDFYPSYFLQGILPNTIIKDGEIENGETNNTQVLTTYYYREGEKPNVTYDRANEIQIAYQTSVINDNFRYTYNFEADSDGKENDSGSPKFNIKTIVKPNSLYIGSESDERDINFTPYNYIEYNKEITLPNLTPFKEKQYLLVNFDCQLNYMRNGFATSLDSTPFSLSYLAHSRNVYANYSESIPYNYWYTTAGANDRGFIYQYEITKEPFAQFYIELLAGEDVVYSNTTNVPFKYANNDTLQLNSILSNDTNVKWGMGLNQDGFIIDSFDKEDLEGVTNIRVIFKGIGNFGGRLFNNQQEVNWQESGQGGGVISYNAQKINMITDISIPVTSIKVDSYFFNFEINFAEGYLDETESENITEENKQGEVTNYFYWQQNKGFGKTELNNKISSLINIPNSHTIVTEDGYLGKVTSNIYNDTQYSEVFQLATLIDQISEDRSKLFVQTFSLERIVNYKSHKYRLEGFTFDAIKGIYSCNYIELKPVTQIEL